MIEINVQEFIHSISCGVLLALAIYHLLLYISRKSRKEIYNLFISLFCVAGIIWLLLTALIIIMDRIYVIIIRFDYNNKFISPLFIRMLLLAFIFSYILTKKSNNEYRELLDYKNNLEKKVAEKTIDLKIANEAKTSFFINLAHETKTPLTLIRSYLDKYIQEHGINEQIDIMKKI